MAYLYRLVVLCFCLFLGIAHAAFPPSTTYQYAYAGTYYSSGEAACDQRFAAVNVDVNPPYSMGKQNPYTVYPADKSYVDCKIARYLNGEFNVSYGERLDGRAVLACPVNSSGTSSCMCVAGFDEVAGFCVPKKSAAEEFCKGMGDVKAPFRLTGTSTGSAPSTSCYMPDPPFDGAESGKGCVTTLGDSVSIPGANGSRMWSSTGVATGAVCSDAPVTGDGTSGQNPGPRAAENPCPSGFPGSVNGTSVCVPSVPNSGIEGTKTTDTKAPDGSTTTEHETTKCNGGVCTTTKNTVVKNAAGETISSTPGNTVTQPVNSLCSKDPGNKVCAAVGLGQASGSGTGNAGGGGGGGGGTGEGSSFGGDCAAGFKANSEDAVVNAMAEETFRQNCKVNPDADSQALGKAASAADPAEAIKKGNGAFSETKISKDDISQVDSIGAGEQCMPDKSIQISGQSFLIPFSNICDPMRYIGLIAVAASMVLAFRIIGSNK